MRVLYLDLQVKGSGVTLYLPVISESIPVKSQKFSPIYVSLTWRVTGNTRNYTGESNTRSPTTTENYRQQSRTGSRRRGFFQGEHITIDFREPNSQS